MQTLTGARSLFRSHALPTLTQRTSFFRGEILEPLPATADTFLLGGRQGAETLITFVELLTLLRRQLLPSLEPGARLRA